MSSEELRMLSSTGLGLRLAAVLVSLWRKKEGEHASL